MTNMVIDVLGWLGAVEVLVAYFLVSVNRVSGKSLLYQALNIKGALLLAVMTAWHGAYPSTFVNIVWIGIGIYALVKARPQVRGTEVAE